MYLAVFVGGLTAFVFCTYWVYHYVDLSLDTSDERGEYEVQNPESASSMGYRNILMPFGESESTTSGSHRWPLGILERGDATKPEPYRKNSV